MSRLSPARSKDLPKLLLVSIWYGILSCLFLYLLPLLILDHMLLSFWPVVWVSLVVSLTLFLAIGLFLRVDMDRLLKDQLQLVFNKLVQAEKMAALGEMTAILAHELKNPLGIIRSSAQFLVSGDRNPEMQQELLHYIVDEVDSLNLVINNLLGLARHKPPRFRKVDLKKEITGLVSHWRLCGDHNKKVEIDVSFPEHLPVLYADFKQIGQVLLNCVANSEEVMPDGGRITISVRELENERIEILLTDTGPGVAEDDLKLVFKKFFTTKKKGVGLGLPVCRQIVRAHNGSITLINKKEGGASVIIRLPLRPLVTIGEDKRATQAPVSLELGKKYGETDTDH